MYYLTVLSYFSRDITQHQSKKTVFLEPPKTRMSHRRRVRSIWPQHLPHLRENERGDDMPESLRLREEAAIRAERKAQVQVSYIL